jgi:hypothetical protein
MTHKQPFGCRNKHSGHSNFRFLMVLGLCLTMAGGVLQAQATLTLPAPTNAATAGQDAQGFSTVFLTASIRQLEDAMLWKEGIAKVIKYNAPPGPWLDDYRGRAAESLRLASVQTATPSDAAALQLLKNQFNNLQQWNNNAVTAQQTMNGTETPGSSRLKDDPLFIKISDCNKFLGAMLTSGVFADSPACH